MGIVKKFERFSRRGIMHLLGRFITSEVHTAAWIRDMSFEHILVIRQHNQMGDMLLAIPSLRAIKETRPDAEVGVVTSTINRDVLLNNPYIDRVFTYDKRNPASHLRLIRDLRRAQYDLVIVLHTVSFSFTSVLLAVLSGARIRVGSTSKRLGDDLTGSYFSLTLPLPDEKELETLNEAEHNLYPLRAIGIDTQDLSPLLVPAPMSKRWAADFDAGHWDRGGVKLAVHPGAGKVKNIWPPECLARVVNEINGIKPVNLVVIEGPRDAAAVAAYMKACDVEGTIINGRGIGDVAALLLRADLVICNDTGVMHVSAAAGARTLAVFGPTDPGRWAPRSKHLHALRAPGGRLASLQPASVVEKAVDILGLVAGTERDP
jgi:ADP-heptose:LPS heptosyltransferase